LATGSDTDGNEAYDARVRPEISELSEQRSRSLVETEETELSVRIVALAPEQHSSFVRAEELEASLSRQMTRKRKISVETHRVAS